MESYSVAAGLGIPGSGIDYAFPFGMGAGTATPIKPKPGLEYVSGGFFYMPPSIPFVLPETHDEISRLLGPSQYEVLLTDPLVRATIDMLVLAALVGEIEILPAIPPKKVKPETPDASKTAVPAAVPPAGEPSASIDASSVAPTAPAGDPNAPVMAPEPEAPNDPEYDLACEIRDFNIRQKDRCETDWKVALWMMGHDYLIHGCKVAEVVTDIGEEGEDKDEIVLRDIKAKPNYVWRFVTDTYMNELGVMTFNPGTQQYIILPKSNYIRMTWLPKNNDPRGTYHLRPAFKAWQVKQALWPEYFKFVHQFASPSLVGNVDENESERPATDEKGNILADAPPVQPAELMVKTLEKFRNGSIIGMAANAKLKVEWPQGKGDTFLEAFDLCNREMVYAIAYSIRATIESKFGSRADGEISQDQVGIVIRQIKADFESALEGVAHTLTAARYGEEVANRLTPKIRVGKTEHQDFASYAHAIANLCQAGYFTMDQMPLIDSMLGLPVRGDEAEAFIDKGEPGAAMRPIQPPINPATRAVTKEKSPK